MSAIKLISQLDPKNPNHHIWKNQDIWWCSFTTHNADGTSQRHRFSLQTGDVHIARTRRNNIFRDIKDHLNKTLDKAG
ncbi:hypothetical protein HW115_06275 [Verrucomicrobiaceae bacterium N1E253]|uniref:Uncharacterized protein n=1 Tax=Oceaniferula marina TaxID=2748318 RepID=A0A851GBU3_9BACT|nr:hypothetical protein [Oceaniferula marina]NWK55208.1 hypothetical protein [Oceaniferula marina]